MILMKERRVRKVKVLDDAELRLVRASIMVEVLQELFPSQSHSTLDELGIPDLLSLLVKRIKNELSR